MRYKYCLFDLDGTLTDPAIGITNSVMHALEKYDIHVEDRSELYPFIGPPLDYSFKTFFVEFYSIHLYHYNNCNYFIINIFCKLKNCCLNCFFDFYAIFDYIVRNETI